jgi:hypothetical protein
MRHLLLRGCFVGCFLVLATQCQAQTTFSLSISSGDKFKIAANPTIVIDTATGTLLSADIKEANGTALVPASTIVSNGTALVLSGTGQIKTAAGNVRLQFIDFSYKSIIPQADGIFDEDILVIALPVASLVGYNGGPICSFPANARSCGPGTGWSAEMDYSGICLNLNLASCNVFEGKPHIPIHQGGGIPIDIPDPQKDAISGTLILVRKAKPTTKH